MESWKESASKSTMAYSIVFTPQAEAEINAFAAFAAYLTNYSPKIAERIMAELAEAITEHIEPRPAMWQHFFLTGAPYRAIDTGNSLRPGSQSIWWRIPQRAAG